MFSKIRLFFQKKNVFPDFRLIQSVFRSIEIFFKKILVSLYLVRLIKTVFLSIEHRESGFLKMDLDFFKSIFFKSFSSFLSLSDSTRLYKEFLVVFLQISCKVSLSLSQYVYFTLPFALFFSFSCIISWFLDKFSNYA